MKRLILTAIAMLGLALPTIAHGASSQPIYFWGNVSSAVRAPGLSPQAELVRPRLIIMFADGSWEIERLHWSGWGSSVAHASDVSSASNGIPNMAEGRRIKKHAEITLSNPGRFYGREVYRCFKLTIGAPATSERLCLEDQHGYWLLESTAIGARAARTARPKVAEFFVGTAPGVGCFMISEASGGTADCYTESANFNQKAALNAAGEVQVCAHHVQRFANPCELGNAGTRTPTYKAGKQVTVGAFRCHVLSSGVTCTVIASGKGFYMTAHQVATVGGAHVVPAPLHLREFLSPDRTVWCVVEDRSCGTYPAPPTRSAQVNNKGNVAFCDVPELVVPPGGHEPDGCFQNWNSKARVLHYGQSDIYDGLLCLSATGGITCTLVSGAGKGKGFRISKSEAVEVGERMDQRSASPATRVAMTARISSLAAV